MFSLLQSLKHASFFYTFVASMVSFAVLELTGKKREEKKQNKNQVLLRWSAERGIPFAAAAAASSSLSAELAAVPGWALSPASRDALDGAAAAAVAAEGELRTLVPKAGAGFVFPGASEGGAVKASEVLLQ